MAGRISAKEEFPLRHHFTGTSTAVALLTLVSSLASAQQSAAPPPAKPAGKTMSQSLGLVVFPAKGQTPDAQKKANANAERQADQKAQAAGQSQVDQYKKAFSACMEGKAYSVK
jgi:hypothetical protein